MKKAAVPSILITVVLLVLGVIAEAQQPKKVHRIGYLSGVDAASDSTRFEAIRQALRERGYIEGQNIAIEYRYAQGKNERPPELVAELVRLKVDIIVVAAAGRWILAAKNATKTIPIVSRGFGRMILLPRHPDRSRGMNRINSKISKKNQTTALHIISPSVDRRQPIFGRQVGDPSAR